MAIERWVRVSELTPEDGRGPSRRQLLGLVGLAGAAGYLNAAAFGGDDAAVMGPELDPPLPDRATDEQAAFLRRGLEILRAHDAQTEADVERLRARWAEPVRGEVDPATLLDDLARCIDLTDFDLYVASQLVHVQQILLAMEADGVRDEDMYLMAMVHDLGKFLMLEGEAQENVVCPNSPIGDYPDGIGFDNVVFPWNHDEFMWSRLAGHVPDHVAWIVRYHSIREDDCLHLMDDRDREYYERWFVPFHHYDLHTKSVMVTDLTVVDRWKPLLRERLPSLVV